MKKRKNSGTNWLRVLLFVIVIAAAAYGVVYFFFPETAEKAFGKSGTKEDVQAAVQQTEETLVTAVEDLRETMRNSGASELEISRVMEQIDKETLEDVLEEVKESGTRNAEALFDALEKRIDFGMMNAEEVKKRFLEETQSIDFEEAFSELGRFLEDGLLTAGDALKDVLNK